MSALLITLLLYLPLTLCVAVRMADVRDRVFLFKGVLVAWAIFTPLTALVNMWLPFSENGDDSSYYDLGSIPVQSVLELLDVSRFSAWMEQPGLPLLLSVVTFLVGPDLLAFKLLNLCFMILLALIWYRIALLLMSAFFARRVFLGILLLTPLWYSVACLLKDLSVVLLQSLFLLGLVQVWLRNTLSAWVLIFLATVALMPFRTFLVIQNLSIMLGGLGLKMISRKSGGRPVNIVITFAVIVVVLLLASNSSMLESCGVSSTHRVIGSDAIQEALVEKNEASTLSALLFPLIYLFTEVTALNPEGWQTFGFEWLRGVLALPWIFCVVPFFMLGLRWLFKPPSGVPLAKGWIARLRASRLVSTPWGILFLFVLSMMLMSWQVGDTTRWRLPDLPVIATIAMAGWVTSPRVFRQHVLVGWIIGAWSLFMGYYALRMA